MQNRESLVHEYFDEVFLVNLEKDLEKKIKASFALKNVGITPKIWTATYGYESPYVEEFEKYQDRDLGKLFFDEFNELELKRKKGFIESPGAWGYIRTYESIIRYSLKKGYNKILIIEDDVCLDRNFERKFNSLLKRIGNQWKILQLGASQYNWDSVPNIEAAKKHGYYSPQLLHTCGSFAIGIDLSIGEELLSNLSHMEAPFDHIPLGKIYEEYKGQCFVSFPNIALPDVRTSTIRGKRDQESHSVKMKWEMRNFDFPMRKPIITFIFDDPKLADKINIGESRIDKIVTACWLYRINGELRPIHSGNSPSLKIPSLNNKQSFKESKILSNNPSDFILELETEKITSAENLIAAIEKLIIHNELDDIFSLVKSEDSAQNDLVSVIIPTYKRSENLSSAIDSVIEQTYDNIEILVVDDNDPTTEYRSVTEALVSQLAKRDQRIKYIKHPKNLNGAAARNTGMLEAKGDYICLLDDDDVYLPNKIEDCLKELQKSDSKIGGVYGGFLGWNSKSNDLDRYKSGDLTYDLLTLQYKNHYLHTNTALYKRSALLAINGFDDSFQRHQDLELNLRYFELFEIGVVPKLVAKLKPAPVPNSNQLFGEKLFEVKSKYLKKFKGLISDFSLDLQDEIYLANWSEVKNHFPTERDFLLNCIKLDEFGLLSFLKSDKEISSTAELREQRSVKQIRDENLHREIESLKVYRDELLSQKEWYESTYERLPSWWKKIGALIRKIN